MPTPSHASLMPIPAARASAAQRWAPVGLTVEFSRAPSLLLTMSQRERAEWNITQPGKILSPRQFAFLADRNGGAALRTPLALFRISPRLPTLAPRARVLGGSRSPAHDLPLRLPATLAHPSIQTCLPTPPRLEPVARAGGLPVGDPL